jgi:hypothetical protein
VQLNLDHNSIVGALNVPHVADVDMEAMALLLGSCVRLAVLPFHYWNLTGIRPSLLSAVRLLAVCTYNKQLLREKAMRRSTMEVGSVWRRRRTLSVRKVVPTLTSTSAEIYLSMAGAKQLGDTRFILVPTGAVRPAGVCSRHCIALHHGACRGGLQARQERRRSLQVPEV